ATLHAGFTLHDLSNSLESASRSAPCTQPPMKTRMRLLLTSVVPRRALMFALLFGTTSACGSPTSPSTPNVQGFWHGGWIITTCATTGSLSGIVDFCSLTPLGEFSLGLTQSGRSLSGPVSVCYAAEFKIAGAIAADGTIALSGQGLGQTIMVSSSVV